LRRSSDTTQRALPQAPAAPPSKVRCDPGTGRTSQQRARLCADLAAAVDVAGNPRRRHASAPQLALAKLQQRRLQRLVLRPREKGVGRRAQQRVPARPAARGLLLRVWTITATSSSVHLSVPLLRPGEASCFSCSRAERSTADGPGRGGRPWPALVLHVPEVPAEAVRGRLQRVCKAARARVSAPVPPVQLSVRARCQRRRRRAHRASKCCRKSSASAYHPS